jgi:DNA invertase Pin-like site-specific DNA recombinase
MKQGAGDTVRRQTDLTEEYCRRHRLRLIDTYLDAGLSGFTGENLNDGSALRALLYAARMGKFKAGTRLVIESLDRLSRREISVAVRLFLDLLDTGLIVVTLVDGEQIFTKERVDNDLTALIIVIVFLSRANNESKVKRERALQAQQAARSRARTHGTPITAECPYWLTLIGKGRARRFVVNVERAQLIERIFNLTVSGLGQWQVCRYLNKHGVPTLSGKPLWRPGMIGHLISSRAVVGEFQPCLSVVENGKRRRVPDSNGPIQNYFPAIVSEELFDQAQAAARSRLRRRGPLKKPAYSNLVVHLGRCAVCGGVLHHYGSSGGWTYLRCEHARYHACSNRFGFSYRHLEAVLFALDDLTELVARILARTIWHRERQSGALYPIELKMSEKTNRRKTRRIAIADRDAAVIRLKLAKVKAQASDPRERDLGRQAMISELRGLIDGVVHHPDLTLTIHLKPDFAGCRTVYVLERDGIRGIQIRFANGTIGLIDRQSVYGLIKPVRCISAKLVPDDGWYPERIDALLQRIEIVYAVEGDWQVVASDPMRLSGAVMRAEQTLGLR